MKKLYIVCTGGFAREVSAYIQDILVDSQDIRLEGMVEPTDEQYLNDRSALYTVASGYPHVKKQIIEKLEVAGCEVISLIHPKAQVASTAKIGRGVIISPFCYVGPDAVLDPHVTIGPNSTIGHDAVVGSFTILSPHTFLGGWSQVGSSCFFGGHSMLAPKFKVGEHSKISAGAICLKDVEAYSLAVGNPATSRVMFKKG